MLSRSAHVERWNRQEFNLATEEGYQKATSRLRDVRPHHLLLTPPVTTFMKEKPTTGDKLAHDKYRAGMKRAQSIWMAQTRLALLQRAQGGDYYFEHPLEPTAWSLMKNLDANT